MDSWFKMLEGRDFDKFPWCLVRTQTKRWLDSGNFLEVKAMNFEDTMGGGVANRQRKKTIEVNAEEWRGRSHLQRLH